VKKGEYDLGWSTMRRALDADPTSVARTHRQVGDYFEAPVDAVKGLHKAFEVSIDAVNWLPRAYAAVALYHAGEPDRAQAGLDRVLASDPTSLASLLYRAQIELDRKRYDQAFKFADRAMKAERQSAVAFYLAGRALEGQKKPENARQMYLSALDRNPSLVPANVRLGILSMQDDKETARQLLLNALTIDPENLEARVSLYQLGH
jgi:tetratricopeptide (TPR) repeat protein